MSVIWKKILLMSAFDRQIRKFLHFRLPNLFGFVYYSQNISCGPSFDQNILSTLKICEVTKMARKTEFLLITNYLQSNMKNLTALLILYLGIIMHLLRYYTLNYVKQLFSKLFSSFKELHPYSSDNEKLQFDVMGGWVDKIWVNCKL